MRERIDPNPPDMPTPGSAEAVAEKCCCPCRDNAFGRGYHHDRYGRPLFLVSEECPLHMTERAELSV